MSRFQDLTGKVFGQLTVIERAPNYNNDTMWLCRCACGSYKVIQAHRLKSGDTKSCGCANRLDIQIEAGHRYGMLEAICLGPKTSAGKRRWLCRCDCGNLKYVNEYCLQTGQSKSCGCISRQLIAERSKKHGETGSRLFNVWSSMKQRCGDPNAKGYKNYGGLGISVCDEWKNDYLSFKEWAMASGYDPDAPRGKCTLDRIDVNGNYEPSNCRFVDMKEQARNRRPYKHKPTRTRPVIRIEASGNETRFNSTADAARAMGGENKRSLIRDCCSGRRPTAYGYKWRFAE